MYVLDVVDHGVKAALLAVMINRVMTRLLTASPALSPPEVAAQLNREFPWDQRTQQFFSLMLGLLDVPAGRFSYVSAGHPGPIHLPRSGSAVLLNVPGSLIGLADEEPQGQVLRLEGGDRLYLFTDGLSEAHNGDDERFSEQRCVLAVEEARHLPVADGVTRLARAAEDWSAPKAPHDDISILAVELA
jgi:sigma-B regulation protein RsbU (phosphoserine phosphatase)